MTTTRRRYVEPFLGGGAVLLDMLRAEEPGLPVATPFLRWVGGKRRLSAEIRQRFGDISVVNSYLATDVNADLVAAWKAVHANVEVVVDWLSTNWPRTPEDYYAVRSMRIEPQAVLSLGARQIYLNLFAFNGLNRQNKRGEFNAPCDKARLVSVKLDTVGANLRAVSTLLRMPGVEIAWSQDFSTTLSGCGDGDVVYCDPPYMGTFTGYSAGGFDEEAQRSLAACAAQAVLRGARVVISNSLAARPLYEMLSKLPGYRVDVVSARRSVSCKGSSRGSVDEILVTVGE